MTSRGGPCDPWLKHPTWLTACRYWKRRLALGPLYCARCSGLILPGSGPASLEVGHIVGRAQARSLGWAVQQANALLNTQPEHRHCNRSAGAIEGNAQRGRQADTESADW